MSEKYVPDCEVVSLGFKKRQEERAKPDLHDKPYRAPKLHLGALTREAPLPGRRDDCPRSLEARSPRIDEIPFSSETKRMTTLHRTDQGTIAYAKGAAEVILDGCASLATTTGTRPLASAHRKRIENAAAAMARKALRVLAVAYKTDAQREDAEQQTVFLGLVGMILETAVDRFEVYATV